MDWIDAGEASPLENRFLIGLLSGGSTAVTSCGKGADVDTRDYTANG